MLDYHIITEYQKKPDKDFYGNSIYTFTGEMDLPPLVTIQDTSVTQGGLFVIKIEHLAEDEIPIIKQEISKTVNIYDHNDYKLAIIPLDYLSKTGSYPVEIYIQSKETETMIFQETLNVKEGNFRKQYLVVDSKIEQATRNEAAYAELAKYFTPVRNTSEPMKLWEGNFIRPVEGRITTEYGAMRFVNGALSGSPHSGIDIGARTGTPIKSSNTGKVVLSMSLILTGETIIIDHGLGIFTVYYHMNQRNVFEGDSVVKGEIIGTVGSTGFSTGPHLHWTTSYYRTNIDPDMLMNWEGID